MVQDRAYKRAHQQLSMGAREAVAFLDALRHHGLLSRRTVAQYVMPALLGGADVCEGTPAYRALEEALYREAIDRGLGRRPGVADDPSEDPVSREAGDYLREVIRSVYDGKTRLCAEEFRYNRHTRDTYTETRELLGVAGMRYLGISGHSRRSLKAGRRAMDMIWMEELYAEDVRVDPESVVMEDDSSPFSGSPVGEPAFGPLVSDPFPGEVIPESGLPESAYMWTDGCEPFAPASTQLRRPEGRPYSGQRNV